jgi:hypothetical protein
MQDKVLFNGQTENGTSPEFAPRQNAGRFTAVIVAKGAAASGVVTIEAYTPTDDWVTVDETTISAVGGTFIVWQGVFMKFRATLSSYVSGAFSVSILGE